MAFMFPWSNFHELNLDWILSVVKEAKEIFVRGEGDIQHAVETADQALETAEQAAAGVIADGAVTIPKVNDEVFNLMAYIVSGSVNAVTIPAGSLVILRKSTIAGVSDGIYVAAADIPSSSVITAADLTQPLPLPDAGGLNYVMSALGVELDEAFTSINAIESGLVIVVDGDNATSSVPVGALAYLKNNGNGLQEGLYTNISNTPYPTAGGTADANVFSAVPNVLNSIKQDLTAVETIVGDGVLSGFTATDLTGAANELKSAVNQKANKTDLSTVNKSTPNNDSSPIAKSSFFYLDGVLSQATAAIAANAPFTNQNYRNVSLGEVLSAINTFLTKVQGLTTTAGTGVNTSSLSFAIVGNTISSAGYFSVTTARQSSDVIMTVNKTVGERQYLLADDINNHTSTVLYYNTDGSVTAPEGLAVGYYRVSGHVILTEI